MVTDQELGVFSGKYRNDFVFLSTTTRIPPEHINIKLLLEIEIGLYYTRASEGYTDFERIMMFKRSFEIIHPFFDGNGRTGRVIMNLLLTQQGYPYLTIPVEMRAEYFESLEKNTFVEFAGNLICDLYKKYTY